MIIYYGPIYFPQTYHPFRLYPAIPEKGKPTDKTLFFPGMYVLPLFPALSFSYRSTLAVASVTRNIEKVTIFVSSYKSV